MSTANTVKSGAYINRMAMIMSYQIMGIHPVALPWALVSVKDENKLNSFEEGLTAEELPAREE
jgi:hypothetical protein